MIESPTTLLPRFSLVQKEEHQAFLLNGGREKRTQVFYRQEDAACMHLMLLMPQLLECKQNNRKSWLRGSRVFLSGRWPFWVGQHQQGTPSQALGH